MFLTLFRRHPNNKSHRNAILKKEKYIFTPKIKDTIIETQINGITQFPIFKHYNPNGKGKLLMFRDSYTEQWRNLIAHHFKESIFIWDPTI